MRALITTSLACFLLLLPGCGEADPSTGSSETSETSGSGTGASSTDGSSDTGFTDSTTTSASDSGTSSDTTATSAGEAGEEGDTGDFDETGEAGEEEGGEMGTPGEQESIFELGGLLGSANELDGEGAFIFIEYDQMGLPVERCLIEFVVTHVSTPTDCTDCTMAFESAISEVNVAIDQDGGCMASGFDQTILDSNIKWGAGAEELLYVDDGTGWALVEAGEAWADMTETEAGMARWDLGINTGK